MIHLVVIENQELIRAGFISLLNSQPDFQVVGEAGNGQEGIVQVLYHRPQVILMDLGMPILDGLQATRLIQQQWEAARILILTNHDEEGYIQQALAAGAMGYILKDAPFEEFLLAIHLVGEGQPYLPTDLMDRAQAKPQLTAAELEVLAVCVAGWSNEQIAQILKLTESAVKSNLVRIYHKLGVANRVQAVAMARRRGFVPLGRAGYELSILEAESN